GGSPLREAGVVPHRGGASVPRFGAIARGLQPRSLTAGARSGPLSPTQPPPGVPSGNRAGKFIAVFLGVILIAAAVGIPVFLLTKQSPAAQASALLKQAMQAGEKSAGFQYVDTWTGGGSTATFSGGTGQNDGTQQITQTTGFGNEQFQVVLAPDQALYFKGNIAALEDQLGVSSSAAAGLTGIWISSQSSDGPYQDLALGLPISSALPDGQLTPTSTEQVTGAGGVSLTRIEGTVANPTGTGHLDVSASSNLPVTFVASYSNGSYGETMTFSAWGTAPSLTVPTSAVAWSTLTTSKPPDGYGSGETPTAAPSATPSPSGVGSAARPRRLRGRTPPGGAGSEAACRRGVHEPA